MYVKYTQFGNIVYHIAPASRLASSFCVVLSANPMHDDAPLDLQQRPQPGRATANHLAAAWSAGTRIPMDDEVVSYNHGTCESLASLIARSRAHPPAVPHHIEDHVQSAPVVPLTAVYDDYFRYFDVWCPPERCFAAAVSEALGNAGDGGVGRWGDPKARGREEIESCSSDEAEAMELPKPIKSVAERTVDRFCLQIDGVPQLNNRPTAKNVTRGRRTIIDDEPTDRPPKRVREVQTVVSRLSVGSLHKPTGRRIDNLHTAEELIPPNACFRRSLQHFELEEIEAAPPSDVRAMNLEFGMRSHGQHPAFRRAAWIHDLQLDTWKGGNYPNASVAQIVTCHVICGFLWITAKWLNRRFELGLQTVQLMLGVQPLWMSNFRQGSLISVGPMLGRIEWPEVFGSEPVFVPSTCLVVVAEEEAKRIVAARRQRLPVPVLVPTSAPVAVPSLIPASPNANSLRILPPAWTVPLSDLTRFACI